MAEGITFTKERILSDMFGEDVNKRYSTVVAKIRNAEVVTINVARDQIFGQPVKLNTGVWEFVAALDEANADGIVYQGPPVVGLATTVISPDKYVIIVRGPMVLKEFGFPAADVKATAFGAGIATLKTAYLALDPPIVTVDDVTDVERDVANF